MLGDQLRKARLRAGLTQEALASKARISREYVSQLERGVNSPTVETLSRICAAMVTAAWRLIRRVEESGRRDIPPSTPR